MVIQSSVTLPDPEVTVVFVFCHIATLKCTAQMCWQFI